MADTYTTNLNLKKPGYDSPADIAVINANMDKIDAAYKKVDAVKLNGKDAKYYTQPRNLLDNSDFKNAINQRGKTSETAEGAYLIDRWMVQTNNNGSSVSVSSAGITLTPATGFCGIHQRLLNYSQMIGKQCTLAVYIGGECACATFAIGSFPQGATLLGVRVYSIDYFHVLIRVEDGVERIIEKVALYEGEYTAETLPPYLPKEYAVEMAECLRYDIQYPSSDISVMGKVSSSGETVDVSIPVPVKMWKAPNFVKASNFMGYCYHPTDGSYKTITGVTVNGMSGNFITCIVSLSESFDTPYMLVTVRFVGGFSFDANL